MVCTAPAQNWSCSSPPGSGTPAVLRMAPRWAGSHCMRSRRRRQPYRPGRHRTPRTSTPCRPGTARSACAGCWPARDRVGKAHLGEWTQSVQSPPIFREQRTRLLAVTGNLAVVITKSPEAKLHHWLRTSPGSHSACDHLILHCRRGTGGRPQMSSTPGGLPCHRTARSESGLRSDRCQPGRDRI
jgi:hypothetical protein